MSRCLTSSIPKMLTIERHPVGRTQIIKGCPSKQASPITVRDWISDYLSYRGLDQEASNKFFWRGIELYRAKIPELRDAFKKNCDLQDWEADIIANDVHAILEKALPQSERTPFQMYVDFLLGFDYYRKLTMFKNRDATLMDYIVGILTWIKFIMGHLLAAIMVCSVVCIIINHR
ncbi:hypothetical protein F4805DRAFT_358281 [Annulohypoxylon moriforme]|nr:hypothetical protein F4805DRAFT_358281 [Annulohypoxylon moriforme]